MNDVTFNIKTRKKKKSPEEERWNDATKEGKEEPGRSFLLPSSSYSCSTTTRDNLSVHPCLGLSWIFVVSLSALVQQLFTTYIHCWQQLKLAISARTTTS